MANESLPMGADVAITTAQFILGALTLVAALAWNNAFRNWFENNPSLQRFGPWIYAVSVTVLAVGAGFGLAAFTKYIKKKYPDARDVLKS